MVFYWVVIMPKFRRQKISSNTPDDDISTLDSLVVDDISSYTDSHETTHSSEWKWKKIAISKKEHLSHTNKHTEDRYGDDRYDRGFIDNDEYEKALEKLKQMRLEFGDNLPELSKAESMLNFLTDKDDSDK